ncbi:hypothetical protein [Kordia jejudonensis]|uniref:hypothetical protein n=1 Tax=Kordia jejudonensis TaxID=1348245 RepID=UPI00156A50BC|nr:hypothetical protein [Kordia jejudonensis]
MGNTDIAWKQIGFLALAGVTGIIVGTFVVAPRMQKRKAKKLAESKKQASTPKKAA